MRAQVRQCTPLYQRRTSQAAGRLQRRGFSMKLETLGWNSFFEAAWNAMSRPDEQPARVITQHRELWQVAGEFGESRAEASGKLRLASEQCAGWPTVGDWVAVSGQAQASQHLLIREVLPRRTQITRKMAGRQIAPQVLATNVDTIFVIMALDNDYNPRRLERYLAQLWESGARVAVLLNKADLCAESAARVEETIALAPGAAVLSLSAASGEGIQALASYTQPGQTIVLLGSSGVGKSTLLNRFLQADRQRTAPVRASDSRGRHTTTARQLFFLRTGTMVIDTPGLRELQLWDTGTGVTQAFADIEQLAQRCRFRNCTHQGEPGCAIAKAISTGELDESRWQNHQKLLREQQFLETKLDRAAQQKRKDHVKTIHRAARKLYEAREKEGKQ
jgi:ribosome biogenesis GTPase / thiamine phosphate phosphatase